MAGPRLMRSKMQSSGPLVSVIIPCYNYGKYLADALESVYAQTHVNWECIVVNDGSTDTTEEVARRYAEKDVRFRYVYQHNGGVSSARNTALKEAKGVYIQLLDADDLLQPHKLALQVALLEENRNVDLVYSNIVFFKEADPAPRAEPQLLQNKAPVSGSGETLLDALVEDNLFLPGCALSRKGLYEDVGDFKQGIEGIEDWDFYYRAALRKKVFYYDAREGTRLLARSHGTNASGNGYKMLAHKLKARKGLMAATQKETGNPDSCFSKGHLQRVYKAHKGFLNRDAARLHLFYGNFAKGCVHMVKHAFYSKRYYFSFYDGGYWMKERMKKKVLRKG